MLEIFGDLIVPAGTRYSCKVREELAIDLGSNPAVARGVGTAFEIEFNTLNEMVERVKVDPAQGFSLEQQDLIKGFAHAVVAELVHMKAMASLAGTQVSSRFLVAALAGPEGITAALILYVAWNSIVHAIMTMPEFFNATINLVKVGLRSTFGQLLEIPVNLSAFGTIFPPPFRPDGGPWLPCGDDPPPPGLPPWDDAEKAPNPMWHDPLVLDLDGDGITTTSVINGPWFDHDSNGFAERSGWINPYDGFLVMDRNGNDIIDNGRELFGNDTILSNSKKASNGFEALADFDGNRDGKIDVSDPIFSRLRIWQDEDGFSLPGELHTLEELGIKAINLSSTATNVTDPQGNTQNRLGSFEWIDGTTGQVGEYTLQRDTVHTIATEWVDVPNDIAALPYLQGYGNLYGLQQAMARDQNGQLKSLVDQFIAESDGTDNADAVKGSLTVMDLIINGENGNDVIYGTDRNERIYSMVGDALLYGCGGDDQLYRGVGVDTIPGRGWINGQRNLYQGRQA